MDFKGLLKGFQFAIAGGFVKLFGQLQFTFIPVKGVWYKAECISDLLFQISFVTIVGWAVSELGRLADTPVRKRFHTYSIWFEFMMIGAINDSSDQFFFDPNNFGWNEKIFFIASLYNLVQRFHPKRLPPIKDVFFFMVYFKFVTLPVLKLWKLIGKTCKFQTYKPK